MDAQPYVPRCECCLPYLQSHLPCTPPFWFSKNNMEDIKSISSPDLRGQLLTLRISLCNIRNSRLVSLKICEPPPQVNFDLKQRSWHGLEVRSLELETWWSFSERKHCAMFVSHSHSPYPLTLLPATTCGLAVPGTPAIEQKSLNFEHIKEATKLKENFPQPEHSSPNVDWRKLRDEATLSLL